MEMEGLEGDDRQVNRDIVRYSESQKSDDNEVKAGSTAAAGVGRSGAGRVYLRPRA